MIFLRATIKVNISDRARTQSIKHSSISQANSSNKADSSKPVWTDDSEGNQRENTRKEESLKNNFSEPKASKIGIEESSDSLIKSKNEE